MKKYHTSLKTHLVNNITRMAVPLQYSMKNPRWGIALIRSKCFLLENPFHRQRICEYQLHVRTLEEAFAIALGADLSAISSALNTLPGKVAQEIETRVYIDDVVISANWDADVCLANACYAICRLLQPTTVVETGVARGITSTFVLEALQENDKGHLYSIDLPAIAKRAHLFVGSAIPQRLRHRWTLILDDSLYALAKVMQQVGDIDVFVHDSEHAYRHQMMEYSLAWNNIRPGGILLSDDIHWSDAFINFAGLVGAQPLVVNQRNKDGYFGLLVKPSTRKPII